MTPSSENMKSSAVDNPLQKRMEEVDTLVAEVEQLCGSAAGRQVERVATLVMDLHRDALKRIIRGLKQAGPAGDAILGSLVDDELVANLLLLHDLHPLDMQERVRVGLEKVRPYLKSHGGDVELVEIAEGSAKLRMQGSCGGCPAMVNSLKMMIEQAVYDVAPDLAGINIEAAAEPAAG